MSDYLILLTDELIDILETYDPYSFDDVFAGADEYEIFESVQEDIIERSRDVIDYLNQIIEDTTEDKLFNLRVMNLRNALQ